MRFNLLNNTLCSLYLLIFELTLKSYAIVDWFNCVGWKVTPMGKWKRQFSTHEFASRKHAWHSSVTPWLRELCISIDRLFPDLPIIDIGWFPFWLRHHQFPLPVPKMPFGLKSSESELLINVSHRITVRFKSIFSRVFCCCCDFYMHAALLFIEIKLAKG